MAQENTVSCEGRENIVLGAPAVWSVTGSPAAMFGLHHHPCANRVLVLQDSGLPQSAPLPSALPIGPNKAFLQVPAV